MPKPNGKGTVRPATPMDSVNIVRLLKQQHAESAARLIGEFDEQRVLQHVAAVLANKDAFIIVVEASGRLLGSAALTPVPVMFCRAWVLAESWFAVVPSWRSQGVPEQLLEALGAVADRVQAFTLLGCNLIAPDAFDDVLGARKDLTFGRTTYVRAPVAVKKEAAA